jgi:hypothetical protein
MNERNPRVLLADSSIKAEFLENVWIYHAEYHNQSDSEVSIIPSSAETCPTPGITAQKYVPA